MQKLTVKKLSQLLGLASTTIERYLEDGIIPSLPENHSSDQFQAILYRLRYIIILRKTKLSDAEIKNIVTCLNDKEVKNRLAKKDAKVIDNSRGIIIFKKGKLVFCNEAAQALSEYSSSELLKMNFQEFFATVFVLKISLGEYAHYTKHVRTIVNKSKDTFSVYYTICNIIYKDTDAVCLIFHPSHTKLISKEYVRKNFDTYLNNDKDIIEYVPDAYFMLDMQGNILQTNARFCQLVGYTHAELHNIKGVSFIPDIPPARLQNMWLEGVPYRHTFLRTRVKLRDGSFIPVEIEGTIIIDHNERYVIGFLRNVSELIIQEKELKVNEESYKMLIQKTPRALIIIDLESKMVMEANEMACRQLGYTYHEIRELTLHDIDPLFASTHQNKQFNTDIDTPFQIIESVHMRKDGSTFPVEVSFGILRNVNAKRVIAFVDDITKKKQIYEEIINSKIAAEKANEAKNEFLAQMSHEFRTPLNAIMGFCNILAEDTCSDEMKNTLALITKAGHQLLNNVQDILAMAKLENQELLMNQTAFSLEDLINSSTKKYHHLFKEKGIKFSIKKEKIVSYVIGDSLRITQIIDKLLSNALKFTHRGEVVLSCKYHSPYTIIKVKDTGIGILADKLDTIFLPFEQVSKDHSRQYTGLGLGLAICRHLLNMMQGEISVVSTPGEGSEFTVEIKLALVKIRE